MQVWIIPNSLGAVCGGELRGEGPDFTLFFRGRERPVEGPPATAATGWRSIRRAGPGERPPQAGVSRAAGGSS